MNQLTTIAALPSGGGCMASLAAEKPEAKPVPLADPLAALKSRGFHGPQSWGVFEPFSYAERN